MESILKEINLLYDTLIIETIRLIPNLLFAIAIFFIGLILAKVAQKLIRQFILYLHRTINEKLKNNFLSVNLQSSAIFISKTFFWIILIFFLALVAQILGLTILTRWFEGLVLYLPNILASVVIVFAGFIIGELTSNLIVSAAVRATISNGKYLGNIMKYTILVISVIIAVDQIGIDIAFLTNLISIILGVLLFGAALAFGLGAKTSVSNILGSYYVQKTYHVGNTVQIGEIEGLIIKITATNVLLETKSGLVTIPSKDFTEEKTILIKKS